MKQVNTRALGGARGSVVGALGAVVLAGLNGGTARADVTWEHSVNVRLTGMPQPVFGMKLYNSWSGQKQRVLVKFSPSQMDGMPSGLPSMNALQSTSAGAKSKMGVAEVAFIHDLQGDRMMAYSSLAREYISEPLRSTFKRVRFDPWKKSAPRLSQEAPPEFTPQQRARLGAEVRAVYQPYLKMFAKLYFRELPNTRSFNGIETRGYRLSWLVNAGSPGQPQWGRVNFEWWLANELEGDAEVRSYLTASKQVVRDMGGMSASMWLNELYPVLWQMMPQELHQSVATFAPPASHARAGFGGTPVRMYMTIVPPALQRAAMGGELRAEVALVERSTRVLADRVFETPQDYKRLPLEPHLKQVEDMMQGALGQLPPGMLPLASPALMLAPRAR
jgi:hypothetical protein